MDIYFFYIDFHPQKHIFFLFFKVLNIAIPSIHGRNGDLTCVLNRITGLHWYDFTTNGA